MAVPSLSTPILLLLSFLTSGSVVLLPLVSIGEDSRPLFLLEEDADSDDVEESLESQLVATLELSSGFFNQAGFHAVTDEVNHQIDWLFVHEHAARAPPLG